MPYPPVVARLLPFQTDFEVLDPPELVHALKEVRARVAQAVAGSV